MQIKDTLIVINSSNRSDKIKTHNLFPNDVVDWVYAVPKEQAESYVEILGAERVAHIPDSVASYLPSQRQWVMNTYGEQYKYIWLMDDDLVFLRRKTKVTTEKAIEYGKEVDKEEIKYLLKKCKKKHIIQMILDMRKHLDGIPMVGISTRLGNNRVHEDYDDINRVTRCYAMNTEVFEKVGATFAPFEPFVAEDFHMSFSFLNKGYPNRVLHTFAQEDIGSNADGGCSLYRTAEVQQRTTNWMILNHEEATIKPKSSKNWKNLEGKGVKNVRVDMIISWKKAYKPIKKRKSGGLNILLGKKKVSK